MCCSSHAKKSASTITPYLMTSASPADSSRGGSVFSVLVSASTEIGWWNAPIMFFARG